MGAFLSVMKPIRALIVDGHALFLKALRAHIEGLRDLEVAGAAKDGMSALALHRALRPELIVMNTSLPELSGLEACGRMKERDKNVKVILYSGIGIDPCGMHKRYGADASLAQEDLFDKLPSVVKSLDSGWRSRVLRFGRDEEATDEDELLDEELERIAAAGMDPDIAKNGEP